MTNLGYNDLVKLRSTLTDIETSKVEIDKYILELRNETSILVENRDTRIPELKKVNAELTSELPVLKQEIQNLELNIASLKQEKQSFDQVNNIVKTRDAIDDLQKKYDGEIRSSIAKQERNSWIFGVVFSIVVGILLSYATYEFGPSLDNRTFTCPDDTTIVSYDQLADGNNDCAGGWDEKDSLWDTEDGESARSDASMWHSITWVLIILAVIAGIVGAGFCGHMINLYFDEKIGDKTSFSLFSELNETRYNHKELFSKSDKLLDEINNAKGQVSKAIRKAEHIDYKLQKLNSLEINSPTLNIMKDKLYGDKKQTQSSMKKPWRCPDCSKSFKSKMAVRIHMKDTSHQGVPYDISEPEIAQSNFKLIGDLKEDDSIPYLEKEVSMQINNISEKIKLVRIESDNIVNAFEQIKHLIPNSSSINSASSDLDEVLNQITSQVGINPSSQHREVPKPNPEEKGILDGNGYEWIKQREENWYRIAGSNSEWQRYEA